MVRRHGKPPEPDCKHTPCPSGYIEWQEWAEKMAKTHEQIRCERCKLWLIWIPKVPAEGSER